MSRHIFDENFSAPLMEIIRNKLSSVTQVAKIGDNQAGRIVIKSFHIFMAARRPSTRWIAGFMIAVSGIGITAWFITAFLNLK